MPDERWTSKAIRDQLKANQSKGLSPSAQVFLEPDVPATDLGTVVKGAIAGAALRLGRPADVAIGKVRPLAKSAAVTGDPAVIAEMLNEPSVAAILPSAIEDVYPKPKKVKPVD